MESLYCVSEQGHTGQTVSSNRKGCTTMVFDYVVYRLFQIRSYIAPRTFVLPPWRWRQRVSPKLLCISTNSMAALPIRGNFHTLSRVDVFSCVFDRWCPTFRSNLLNPSTGFIHLLIFGLHDTHIWRLDLLWFSTYMSEYCVSYIKWWLYG